jgi:hypothetical protein
MTDRLWPDPLDVHPMPGHPRVTFLKPYVTRSHVEVGDFTYYDDPSGADAFERNVLYHFARGGEVAAAPNGPVSGAGSRQGRIRTPVPSSTRRQISSISPLVTAMQPLVQSPGSLAGG